MLKNRSSEFIKRLEDLAPAINDVYTGVKKDNLHKVQKEYRELRNNIIAFNKKERYQEIDLLLDHWNIDSFWTKPVKERFLGKKELNILIYGMLLSVFIVDFFAIYFKSYTLAGIGQVILLIWVIGVKGGISLLFEYLNKRPGLEEYQEFSRVSTQLIVFLGKIRDPDHD